ncbi:Metal-independent alpha-mannosidase [Balamuthia mandrillaris]
MGGRLAWYLSFMLIVILGNTLLVTWFLSAPSTPPSPSTPASFDQQFYAKKDGEELKALIEKEVSRLEGLLRRLSYEEEGDQEDPAIADLQQRVNLLESQLTQLSPLQMDKFFEEATRAQQGGGFPLEERVRQLQQQLQVFKPLVGELIRKEDAPVVPLAVAQEVERVAARLAHPKLQRMFRKCFVSTLETTTQLLPDGTTHIFTGDIPAMWLRDSSAQVHHYLPLAASDLHLQVIIEGLITRQANRILHDPYANAFRLEPFPADKIPPNEKKNGKTPEIWERKYEVDSLCYFLSLSYQYWQATGSTSFFDSQWKKAAELIVQTWINEQVHDPNVSPYKYHSEMPNRGVGAAHTRTGMTWSGFRPSDDPCRYNFLVPSNMFAVVVLRQLSQIAKEVLADETLASRASRLAVEIDDGIHQYAVVNDPQLGKIYAYETDGLGNHNLMDDANVPSLLSIPYMGYTSRHDPEGVITANTRKWVLSPKNKFYYQGKLAKGIGSPHTYNGYIWHMSLIMQALSSDDPEEVKELVRMCMNTDNNSDLMHESFHPDNPARFSRAWFAWANSLFGELVRTRLDIVQEIQP